MKFPEKKAIFKEERVLNYVKVSRSSNELSDFEVLVDRPNECGKFVQRRSTESSEQAAKCDRPVSNRPQHIA